MERTRAVSVIPRSLADDISYVEATDADVTRNDELDQTASPDGERCARTIEAMAITADFGAKAGGRVQMLKCFIFASRETTRAEARNIRFGPDQDPCPVKTSFRDLGAHFDVARTAKATTLNKRAETSDTSCARRQSYPWNTTPEFRP